MTDACMQVFTHDCRTWVAIETTDDNPAAWLASTITVPVEQ